MEVFLTVARTIVVFVLIILILSQFLISVQIWVDERLQSTRDRIDRMSDFLQDKNFEVEDAEPGMSVGEWYRTRNEHMKNVLMYQAEQNRYLWSTPLVDGLSPKKGFVWKDGKLVEKTDQRVSRSPPS